MGISAIKPRLQVNLKTINQMLGVTIPTSGNVSKKKKTSKLKLKTKLKTKQTAPSHRLKVLG